MSTDVSVVIPTYNDGDVIDRAIDSVLTQTHTDFELIVVDDGSEDDTGDVVATFDDDRVTLLRHSSNQGAAAARNTGIRAGTGQYIAFLDADDEWDRKKLQRQTAQLAASEDEVVASYCAADVKIRPSWDLARRIYKQVTGADATGGREGGSELIDAVLRLEFSISGSSTLLVERDTVETIDGFDEAFDRHQDLEFLIRVLEHGTLVHLDEELVTKHDAGRPPSTVAKRERMRFLNKFSDRVFELEMAGHDVIDQHRVNLAVILLSNGEITEGVSNLCNRAAIDRTNTPRLVWSLIHGLYRTVTD